MSSACDAVGPSGETSAEAIAKWNAAPRAPLPDVAELVPHLREATDRRLSETIAQKEGLQNIRDWLAKWDAARGASQTGAAGNLEPTDEQP